MAEIIVDAATGAKLRAVDAFTVVVKDETGRVLGHFRPATDPADYLAPEA